MALFTVSGVVCAGLAFTVIMALSTLFPSIGLPMLTNPGDVVVATTVGGAIHLIPALITGGIMATLSRGIVIERAWLVRGMLITAAASVGVALVLLGVVRLIRPTPYDAQALMHVFRVTLTLAIAGAIGGLGGAASTIRLRPRSGSRTVAAVFT